MAADRDQRIVSATFFASQVDFTHSGDLRVFIDEEQIAALMTTNMHRDHGL
jgi:polyhydroxyalkanoate synthase